MRGRGSTAVGAAAGRALCVFPFSLNTPRPLSSPHCSNSEALTPARLKTAHCVVLATPTAPLSAAEVSALQEFVDGGGSLVVFSGEGGPGGHGSNLNDVVSKCALPPPPRAAHARIHG